ncbi:MAG: hypothetical protein UR28_C0014G0005 [Candidatus Peregrinibacteria bacterium GW2011_GWF2_33_10]|nr:MAG: hypothetical protein UR28_C0014G0005 [Candidatus Peregrinibacteria bacterium GW2011_GWF2_33_10]
MENTHFRLSTAGQLAQRFRSEDRQDLVEEGEGLEQIDKNLMPYVFEVRALIGRINEIKGRKQQIDTVQEANLPALIFGSDGVDFSDLFDDDLIARYLESKDPNYSKQQEINEVVGRLRELLSNKNILKAYQDYFKIIIEKYHRMRKMKTAYEKGELVKRDGTGKKKSMKLNVDDKTFAGQQFVTILRDLMSDAALEIQNIHNRVSNGDIRC